MEFKYTRFTENRTIQEAQELFEQRISDAKYIFEKYAHKFEQRECPICGHAKYQEREKFIGLYGVANCNRCASQYVNPVPPKEALADYYQNCKTGSLANAILRKRAIDRKPNPKDPRLAEVFAKVKQTHARTQQKVRVLEVGCNSGGFLADLKSICEDNDMAAWVDLYGIDLDNNAVAAPVHSSLKLFVADAEDFAKDNASSFDIICFFELIEHLPDPLGFMRNVRRMVSDGGAVILTTPNLYGLENVALGYNGFRPLAHAIFPPMHLNAFSTHNIVTFALQTQFQVQSLSTPGNLDIDLVSTFSEQTVSPVYAHIKNLPEQTRAHFQELLKGVFGSSHMMATLLAGE